MVHVTCVGPVCGSAQLPWKSGIFQGPGGPGRDQGVEGKGQAASFAPQDLRPCSKLRCYLFVTPEQEEQGSEPSLRWSPSPGCCSQGCAVIAGSTAGRSRTCVTAAGSALPRPAHWPTTCGGTRGRSRTSATAAEKPLPCPAPSSPTPANTQVQHRGWPTNPPWEWSPSSFLMLFCLWFQFRECFLSHWMLSLFHFDLFLMCILVYVLK